MSYITCGNTSTFLFDILVLIGTWLGADVRIYRDLNTRKQMREKAWSQQGWPETVVKTARLADIMDASILTPLSFSPLK
jgi:hypothetical protein